MHDREHVVTSGISVHEWSRPPSQNALYGRRNIFVEDRRESNISFPYSLPEIHDERIERTPANSGAGTVTRHATHAGQITPARDTDGLSGNVRDAGRPPGPASGPRRPSPLGAGGRFTSGIKLSVYVLGWEFSALILGCQPSGDHDYSVRMRTLNPLHWAGRLADWFDSRGVYVPGEESREVEPWRDFGWMIVAWIVALGMLVLFFALAS